MSCGGRRRRDSDLVLLWLWCRPTATALIQPLAWELPRAAGTALKRKKKNLKCLTCFCQTAQDAGGGEKRASKEKGHSRAHLRRTQCELTGHMRKVMSCTTVPFTGLCHQPIELFSIWSQPVTAAVGSQCDMPEWREV